MAALLRVLITLFLCKKCLSVSYSGHRVVRVLPHSDDEMVALTSWLRQPPVEIDVWRWPTRSEREAAFRVSPEDFHIVTRELSRQHLTWDLPIPDLQGKIDDERAMVESARRKLGVSTAERKLASSAEDLAFVSSYHNFDEIKAWCQQIVERYSCVASTEELGTSSEGRPIFGIRISAPAAGSIFGDSGCSSTQSQATAPRPTVYLDAGTHSREWITVGAILVVIQSILNGYYTSEILTQLLTEVDFFIVPVTNPDGWEYSITTDRMWRKTRGETGGGSENCKGADMNRNYDHHWREIDGSTDKCAENYAGASAADQPETRALQDFLLANAANIGVYVTFHNWGECFYRSDYSDFFDCSKWFLQSNHFVQVS
jgi:hypothetical protein